LFGVLDQPAYSEERPVTATPRRRFWRVAVWTAALGLLVLVGAGTWPILSGRTESPRFAREAAEKALRDARDAGAARWAPDPMRAAESALRAAQMENRIQEVRFLPLRDFRTARVGFSMAETRAREALEACETARAGARGRSEEALRRAEADTSFSEAFADAIHLGPLERRALQKAKIGLTEARLYHERGEYLVAAERAEEAATQAREVSRTAASAAERFTEPRLVANWRKMAADTIAWSRETGGTAIVVYKENRRLDVVQGGRVVRSYPADMGYRSFQDKLRAGDAATPEGRYQVNGKRGAGRAQYYKALDLDYPNAEDRKEFVRLKKLGKIPRHASLGGSIQIHGEGGRGRDWTRGCVAVSNRDMDDLFGRIAVGTPVTIVGGDGTGIYARLARQHASTMASEVR
jgi:L,D-peptidoglycan transpeptidase YkuD (ErfK/YbiS/YcfS/YnhG family)